MAYYTDSPAFGFIDRNRVNAKCEAFNAATGKTFAFNSALVYINTAGTANFTLADGSTTGLVSWAAGATLPVAVASVAATGTAVGTVFY